MIELFNGKCNLIFTLKQAQDVIFSSKINKIYHTPLYFNQNFAKSSPTHKLLGLILYAKLEPYFNFEPRKPFLEH